MKKIMLMLAFGTGTLAACKKETVLSPAQVPAQITTYVETHFPSHEVIQVIKDIDNLVKTYDIMLSDGLSLEFNRSTEIISIDGTAALPLTVIPVKIQEYVATAYPDRFITDWEIDRRNQQVELDNGLDLVFDKQGNFLRIDN